MSRENLLFLDSQNFFTDLGNTFEIKSPISESYNCIAFAANDESQKWWPDKFGQVYWPIDAPRNDSVEAFIKAFETIGYKQCLNFHFEDKIQKIAFYVDPNNKVKHAAIQTNTGRWKSKLGDLEDIEHDLRDVEGKKYGQANVYMSRSKQ